MTYAIEIGPWHIGPFPTHIAAQHFAETHGLDDFRMVQLDDPAEAPGKIHRLRRAALEAAQLGGGNHHPFRAAPASR
jgi:hypothetical protein